jgi:hypothetical protein
MRRMDGLSPFMLEQERTGACMHTQDRDPGNR